MKKKKFSFYLRRVVYHILLALLALALFFALSISVWCILIGLCCVVNTTPTIGLFVAACVFGFITTICLVFLGLDRL